jgi:hypothetical protein
MKSDNTLMYVALGGVALYLLMQRKATVPVPVFPGTTQPNPAYQPVQQPNAGSVLLPLLSTAGNIFSSIFNQAPASQPAAVNVAEGYNPDGTIALPDQTQSSIDQLSQSLLPASLMSGSEENFL